MKWRLRIESARPTVTAFVDCILYATYTCMYVAFETNPQGYRQLSSSTARGFFRRINRAYLSVSLFPANRCNDGMGTSFELR